MIKEKLNANTIKNYSQKWGTLKVQLSFNDNWFCATDNAEKSKNENTNAKKR